VALDGLILGRRHLLALAFFHLKAVRENKDSSSNGVGSGFARDLAFKALQIYFFDHRCHIWPFRFQIDLLDSGINDLLDCSGKPCCTSIRALFAKEHRKTFGASVVFYPSIDCSGMLTQSTSRLFDMNEGSFGVPHVEERL
jgi:hypothetical protein